MYSAKLYFSVAPFTLAL